MSKKNLKILVAIDSFKDSVEASVACSSFANAWRRLADGHTADLLPLSDGGEGFLACCLASDPSLETVVVDAVGPRGETRPVTYAVRSIAGNEKERKRAAVVEMALSSGLELVPPEDKEPGARDPLKTTAFGLGQVMRHAVSVSCCDEILLGVGGSATSEGGISVLQGMGCSMDFGDNSGDSDGNDGCATKDNERFLSGCDMSRVRGVDTSTLVGGDMFRFVDQDKEGSERRHCTDVHAGITIACDVRTPFSDAVEIFSPQKGARTVEQRQALQDGMKNLREVYRKLPGSMDVWDIAGTGAAGGVPGALLAALPSGMCRITSGVDVIASATGLAERVKAADIVVTGEGSFDSQTGEGKAPSLVIKLAKEMGKKVIVICGKTSFPEGPDLILPLVSEFPVEDCLGKTAECIEKIIERRWQDCERIIDNV